MTPGARVAAAIGLIDQILAGNPADRALVRWSRDNRYAGSKDRNAVRDIVFDCLRRRRSLGYRMGADTGRALSMARTLEEGDDLATIFSGEGFSAALLSDAEQARSQQAPAPAPRPVALDYPDFLDAELEVSLGTELGPVMAAMQDRAPVDLRVNTLRGTPGGAQIMLAQEGIQAIPHPLTETALRVTQNPRRVAGSRAYRSGLVELQDVSSQAVAVFTGVHPEMSVLDFCAGGGGKALALAALMENRGRVVAHDANVARMKDLPERAGRAGAHIEILEPAALADTGPEFELVLVDAPCSGTGAWRRKPDAKWRLNAETLTQLTGLQREILGQAKDFVRPGGMIAYATCSILNSENQRQIEDFISENPDFELTRQQHWTPIDGGDGFYCACCSRKSS